MQESKQQTDEHNKRHYDALAQAEEFFKRKGKKKIKSGVKRPVNKGTINKKTGFGK